jgi:hypothetical protein
MLAVEQLLGVDALGGVYQPLRAAELRPRGAIREGVEPAGGFYDNDRLRPEQLRELIDAQLAVALVAARELDAGALEPRPPSCSPGGCRHPAICRAQAR